jgi:hypothetical protein
MLRKRRHNSFDRGVTISEFTILLTFLCVTYSFLHTFKILLTYHVGIIIIIRQRCPWRQRQFIFHYRRGAAAADVEPRWTSLSSGRPVGVGSGGSRIFVSGGASMGMWRSSQKNMLWAHFWTFSAAEKRKFFFGIGAIASSAPTP